MELIKFLFLACYIFWTIGVLKVVAQAVYYRYVFGLRDQFYWHPLPRNLWCICTAGLIVNYFWG
ncbi:MAG: hypothetical protein ACK5LG_21780 [Bacteroides thetaiotaomicron]